MPKVFLFLFLLPFCWCEFFINKEIPLQTSIVFETFGFAEGGTINMTYQPLLPQQRSFHNISFSLCTSEEYIEVINSFGFWGDIPLWNNFDNCELFDILPSLSEYAVKTSSEYYFILSDSFESVVYTENVKVVLNYTLMNPNNEHLPLAYIPLVKSYLVFSIIYGSILWVWVLSILFRRIFSNSLYHIFFLMFLLRLCGAILTYFFWTSLHDTGIRKKALELTVSIFFALSETSLFCLILLLSRGYKITSQHIFPHGGSMAIFALILWILLIVSFYNLSFFTTIQLVLYFFWLPRIVAQINRNRIILLTYHPTTPELESSKNAKIVAFERLRQCVLIYMFSLILLLLIQMSISWRFAWVSIIFNEIATIFVLSSFLFIFWPYQSNQNLFLSVNIESLFDFNDFPDSDTRRLGLLEAFLNDIINFNKRDFPIEHAQLIKYPSNKSRYPATISSFPLALALKNRDK